LAFTTALRNSRSKSGRTSWRSGSPRPPHHLTGAYLQQRGLPGGHRSLVRRRVTTFTLGINPRETRAGWPRAFGPWAAGAPTRPNSKGRSSGEGKGRLFIPPPLVGSTTVGKAGRSSPIPPLISGKFRTFVAGPAARTAVVSNRAARSWTHRVLSACASANGRGKNCSGSTGPGRGLGPAPCHFRAFHPRVRMNFGPMARPSRQTTLRDGIMKAQDLHLKCLLELVPIADRRHPVDLRPRDAGNLIAVIAYLLASCQDDVRDCKRLVSTGLHRR